jgi:hypothetical protein
MLAYALVACSWQPPPIATSPKSTPYSPSYVLIGKDLGDHSYCDVKKTADVIVDFIDAFNSGDGEQLKTFFDDMHFVAFSSGDYDTARQSMVKFSRFGSVSGEPETMTKEYRATEIAKMPDYFKTRHTKREKWRLLSLSQNGGTSVSFSIQRTADDLNAELFGPNFIATGKGEVECQYRKLLVWVMGQNSEPLVTGACKDTSVESLLKNDAPIALCYFNGE